MNDRIKEFEKDNDGKKTTDSIRKVSSATSSAADKKKRGKKKSQEDLVEVMIRKDRESFEVEIIWRSGQYMGAKRKSGMPKIDLIKEFDKDHARMKTTDFKREALSAADKKKRGEREKPGGIGRG